MQRIGAYSVVGRITESPQASILEAFGESGQRVALKLLTAPAAGSGPVARPGLHTELAAVARLQHPNIVRLLDFGEHAGRPYLVMEYCDGLSVKDVLALAGQFSAPRTLEVMADACEGLAAAHSQGIVHRDVKPGNIMLLRSGPAKLGDFGVAATRQQASAGQQHAVPGTVPYMSPEQTRGEVLDARSDVWGAGATMYEMLSGTKPFPGGTHKAVLRQIRAEEPRPLEPVPAAVWQIVHKCLRKERAERYRSAGELATALRMALEQQL